MDCIGLPCIGMVGVDSFRMQCNVLERIGLHWFGLYWVGLDALAWVGWFGVYWKGSVGLVCDALACSGMQWIGCGWSVLYWLVIYRPGLDGFGMHCNDWRALVL